MTETNATPSARTRTLPPRDARGRFVARLGAAPSAPRVGTPLPCSDRGRVRALPSRDARGRFVSFPTTSAPSWYVLCADGYRIPGEVEVMPMRVSAPPAPSPQPLPPARVVRRRRPAMRRDAVVNWLVMLAFLVGMYWYAFSLPVPHR
jgi:hypothetical protein